MASTMLVHYRLSNSQAKSVTFWVTRHQGVEDFVPDGLRNPWPVVGNAQGERQPIALPMQGHLTRRARSQDHLTSLVRTRRIRDGLSCVAHDVEHQTESAVLGPPEPLAG